MRRFSWYGVNASYEKSPHNYPLWLFGLCNAWCGQR